MHSKSALLPPPPPPRPLSLIFIVIYLFSYLFLVSCINLDLIYGIN